MIGAVDVAGNLFDEAGFDAFNHQGLSINNNFNDTFIIDDTFCFMGSFDDFNRARFKRIDQINSLILA